LRIPNRAIYWRYSCYDGARLVLRAGNSGEIVLRETDVNARVAAAGIVDCSGAAVANVRDTNGLEIDPAGGLFATPFGQGALNLWFSGFGLQNATVLTTAGGGAVAVMNATPLASLSAVGLTDPCDTTLDGLAENPGELCHLTTDTPTGSLLGGETVRVEVGGARPITGMLWSVAAGPGAVDVTIPFANACFPELYPAPVLLHVVPISPDQCGVDTQVLPSVPFPYRAIAQAVSFDASIAAWELGTPTVIDVK